MQRFLFYHRKIHKNFHFIIFCNMLNIEFAFIGKNRLKPRKTGNIIIKCKIQMRGNVKNERTQTKAVFEPEKLL